MKLNRLVLVFSFVLLCLSNLSAAEKIIIDTDIAEDIDDLITSAFALASPELEVLAITTVDGNVAARSRVARRLCQIMGRTDVQVASGYVRSMPRPDTLYLGLSGGVRYGEIAPEEMEKDLPPESPLKADSLIAALAHKYPGEVTVVTIGSMANIGQFLTRYPEAARKLKRIVTNGGYFTGDNEKIGWNLRYDPVAALITLRSDVPWVLLSEATCHAASPGEEGVKRLKDADTELTRFLLEGIHWWQTNKTDATTWPHVSDLNTFAYLLGGYVDTRPGQVVISVGPVGSLPGFRAIDDPNGSVTLGSDIPEQEASVLRELFLRRLCE